MNMRISNDPKIDRISEPSPELIDAICTKSHEPHILVDTPKDGLERFRARSTFMKWWLKGRVLYTLSYSDEISGIVWFSKQHPSEHLAVPATFAIRLYESALGRGLALPFMEVAHADFMNHFEQYYIWLSVQNSNRTARSKYDKFGYLPIADDGEQTLMLYDRGIDEF